MKPEIEIIQATKNVITVIRNQPVIIDTDLAVIYGVTTKRLNEQIKRNLDKFPSDFCFQLTSREEISLRSHFATSNKGRGGRRYPPFAFTEFGVLQAANVLRSELANKVSVFVIRAFVEMREIIFQQHAITGLKGQLPKPSITKPTEINQRFDTLMQEIRPKIGLAIGNVLDSVIDVKRGTTVREEAQDILSKSIAAMKDRLKKSGLENEEVAARIAKTLAEVEKVKATTRKTQAETDHLEFLTMVRKLRLVIEAQKLFLNDDTERPELNRLQSFTNILYELTD